MYGGTLMEESLIPRFAFTQGGSPVESALFKRILQYDINYIINNERRKLSIKCIGNHGDLRIRKLETLLIFLHRREESRFFHFRIMSDWTHRLKISLQKRCHCMFKNCPSYVLQLPRRMTCINSI